MKQKKYEKQEIPRTKYYLDYKIDIRNKDKQAIVRVLIHKYYI